MGFVCPIIFEAKNLMQQLWLLKKDWDDPLPEEERLQWERWLNELSSLSRIEIPRCYFTTSEEITEISLHNFADASSRGYGTCSYLRYVTSTGRIGCAFVVGRSRCAPVKTLSIPRLELQAATLAVRVYLSLKEHLTLNIDKVTFWSDSQTTLQYIKNEDRRFLVYVANRVAEIREATDPGQWRHCPGPLNPADDASRGLKPEDLASQHRWWTGPEFLSQSEDCWPCSEVTTLPVDDTEVQRNVRVNSTVKDGDKDASNIPDKVTTQSGLHKVAMNNSSWVKLNRAIAWVVRFCQGIKTRNFTEGNLILEELEQSTLLISKDVQAESFSEDIDRLLKKGRDKTGSKTENLQPMLVQGVLG
jgi:hypothetical protein